MKQNNPANNGRVRNQSQVQHGHLENNIKEYSSTIRRGKWWIMLITLIVFGIALFITFQQEPVYQARTSVMLYTRAGQQSAFIPGIGMNSGRNIRNELEILKSRQLAEIVAQSLLQRTYLDQDSTTIIPAILHYDEDRVSGIASLGVVTRRMQTSVTFDHVRDTDIILVTARSTDPREAALISQTYAQIYFERNHQMSRAQSRSVREFLEMQMRDRERDLKLAENRLQDYMETQGVVTVDRESQRVIDQIAALEARREELAIEIASWQQTLSLVRDQLEEQEPGVAKNLGSTDDAYILMLQQQIAQIEVERDRAVAHNPEIIGEQQYQNRIRDIDNRLQNLRATLQVRTQEYMRELTPGDAGYLRQMMQRLMEGDIELQGLQLQQEAIGKSMQEYERQFEQLPRMSMDFARLKRSHQSAEQLYLFIEQKYNEALIAEQSEFGIVDIIDAALVPSLPVSPNIPRNLIQALILGLGLGIAFVFFKNMMSGRINTPEEVRRRGYKLLTIIGDMNNEISRKAGRGVIPIYKGKIDKHILSATNPISPVSESYRWLRTCIDQDLGTKQSRTVLVTSPNPGEGKSVTTANLASTYAQAGERVLLIDTDIRRPNVHTLFNIPGNPGLTNVLYGEMGFIDAIQNTPIENLDVLTCGTTPHNPASIYGTQLGWLKMKALVDALKERYDLILFDSAPLLAVTDSSVIASFVDGVIIVIAPDVTKFGDLDTTEESIQTVGGKLLGVVVNRFDYRYAYSNGGKYYKYDSYRQKPKEINGERKKKKLRKMV